ncbi:hypothetical protein FOMPIDRAFT_1020398, partial [Fomitopsis schrenkii]
MPSSKRLPRGPTVFYTAEVSQCFDPSPIHLSSLPFDIQQIQLEGGSLVNGKSPAQREQDQKPSTKRDAQIVSQGEKSAEGDNQTDESDNELSDKLSRIVQEVFGEYATHPEFPDFQDISQFVVTDVAQDDWELFQEAVESRKDLRCWKYYYDKETKTLHMMPPLPGHDMLALALKQGYAEVSEQIPRATAPLLDTFNQSMMATEVYLSIKDSANNKKHPDVIPGVQYNDHVYVLGPVEVGNTQPLHGSGADKVGVLETLKRVADRQWEQGGHKMEVMYPQLVGFKLYPVPLGKTSKKKLEVQRAMGRKGKGKEVVVKEEDQEYQGEEDMSMYASASIPTAPRSPASVPPSAPAAAGSSSTSALSATPIPSSTSAAPSPAVPAASALTTPTLYLSHTAYNVMKEKKGNTFEGNFHITSDTQSQCCVQAMRSIYGLRTHYGFCNTSILVNSTSWAATIPHLHQLLINATSAPQCVMPPSHRDSKDEAVCLVLVIGDFDSGELVLYEPGLVLPLPQKSIRKFSAANRNSPPPAIITLLSSRKSTTANMQRTTRSKAPEQGPVTRSTNQNKTAKGAGTTSTSTSTKPAGGSKKGVVVKAATAKAAASAARQKKKREEEKAADVRKRALEMMDEDGTTGDEGQSRNKKKPRRQSSDEPEGSDDDADIGNEGETTAGEEEGEQPKPTRPRPKLAYSKHTKSSTFPDAEEEALANNLAGQSTGTSRKAVSSANPNSQAAKEGKAKSGRGATVIGRRPEAGKGKGEATAAALTRSSGGRETDAEKDELEGSGEDSDEYHLPEEELEDGEGEEDEDGEEDEEDVDVEDGEHGEGSEEGDVDEAMAGPEDSNVV